MRAFFLASILLTTSACGHRYIERGDASWYGPGFRGKPTASGEPFRSWRLTAAHKTLPLGSVVRVKRLDNDRTVRVVINDRGPYIEGRIIDLSRRSARRLRMVQDGVAPVQLRVVGCRERYEGC